MAEDDMMLDNGETREQWEQRITRAQMRGDAQEFLQVMNLTGSIYSPKVFYRLVGGDFGAEVPVWRPGRKRPRKVFATGPSRAEALENLAAAVAAFLHPVKGQP